VDLKELQGENERVWDSVARHKYALDVDGDVAFLKAGGTSLMSHERRLLGDLASWCGRAIHLQCSHGRDALSLWKLGAREIIGVDISERCLRLQIEKRDLWLRRRRGSIATFSKSPQS